MASLKVTTWITVGVMLTSATAAIAAETKTEKKKDKPTGEACRAACEKDLRAKGL